MFATNGTPRVDRSLMSRYQSNTIQRCDDCAMIEIIGMDRVNIWPFNASNAMRQLRKSCPGLGLAWYAERLLPLSRAVLGHCRYIKGLWTI